MFRAAGVLACAALAFSPPFGGALAATGDLHRVSAERLNLRAGPSDATNVRGQLETGEELLELRRDGGWLGIRVLRTGQEGWVFSELTEQVSTSGLGGEGAGQIAGPATTGFLNLSEDFDRVLGEVQEGVGYALITGEPVAEDGTLTVTATPEWIRDGAGESHVFATTAIYQMFKNYRNGGPVRVVLQTSDGSPYVTIDDNAADGRVQVTPLGEG